MNRGLLLAALPVLGALALVVATARRAQARTVSDVVARYGPAAEGRLKPHFAKAGVAYPPRSLVLIGLKEERQLELWADDGSGAKFVHSYPVQRASGGPGPKLREGDFQVPEGLYKIQLLNPNSSYHLSMRVSYPNDFDKKQAAADGRTRLGGDIYIHGKNVSIGCLAMGDEAIEELFVLASKVRPANIDVILAPRDFRKRGPQGEGSPAWVRALYGEIDSALGRYRL